MSRPLLSAGMSGLAAQAMPVKMSREQQLQAQLAACRAVLDETLYCNRQLETVIRCKDLEIAERDNLIEHLQGKLTMPAHRPGVPYE